MVVKGSHRQSWLERAREGNAPSPASLVLQSPSVQSPLEVEANKNASFTRHRTQKVKELIRVEKKEREKIRCTLATSFEI